MSATASTETNRANVQALIEGITTGKGMEVFEALYGDDVVMVENGVSDPARVGKDANRSYEQFFADNSEWFDVRVDSVMADGNRTSYEMWMDLAFQGHRMQRHQVAIQQWKDGKITKEHFYYS